MAWKYYKWEEVDIKWENLNMTWEEVGIAIHILGEFGSGVIPTTEPMDDFFKLKAINKLPEKKKKRIIKLACKLSNEGGEYINYKYKRDDIIVTADHINIIITEVIKNKIKIDVQNIS